MDFLPVLSSVNLRGDDLVLRIDIDSAGKQGHDAKAQILELLNCPSPTESYKAIKNYVSELVEYELFEDEVEFSFDYGWREVTVPCSSWSLKDSALNKDDLIVRSQSLSKNLESYARKYHAVDRDYSRLRAKLRRDAEKEIESAKRKIDFFKDTHPSKAESIQKLVAFCRKVLKSLESPLL
ncbi:MAG: hypothetical protein AAF564_12275 [Bacteroidota bacterium]